VYIFSDVIQIDIHIAEPLVPGPSHLEVETAIAQFKKYKLRGSKQIAAELIQTGGKILVRSTSSLILFRIRKNCLSVKSVVLPV
jgi:hypothetical protein